MSVRPVTMGALFGELRSIVSGVAPEDRIVVNGQMHARPGSVVAPIDAPIKVNEADFSDPGSDVAGMTPVTDANSSVSAIRANVRPTPPTPAATETRE